MVPGHGGAGTQQEPSVSVTLEGMQFPYQLLEDDLHEAFSRYGPVKGTRVGEAGLAPSSPSVASRARMPPWRP